jgi:hypothetical protein
MADEPWNDYASAGPWSDYAPAVDQAKAQAETGAWSSKLGRLAQGAMEPIMGAGQLASHLTGVGASYMDKKTQEWENFYQKSRTAAGLGKDDWDYWAGAGNVASPINYVPGVAAERLGVAAAKYGLGNLGRAAVTGATAGATGSAAQPVTNISPDNNYWAQKGEQTATGGIGGALLGPAASMAGNALIPEVVPAAKKLAQEGTPLTAGQMGGPGSWIKRLEDVGEKAPIVGGTIRERREEALEGVNRVVFDKVLEPVGEKLPGNVAPGHEGFNWAEDRLSQKYNELHPKLTLKQDDALKTDLENLFDEHSIDLVEPRQKQLMNFINKKITDRIDERGGEIGGADIQKITSELAHQGRKWMKAVDPDQRALGEAFRDVRAAVNSALERQNPQFAQDLGHLNASWSRLMTIEPAIASTASAARQGVFTPTQLEGAVKRASSQRQMARGTAWGQDVAEAAKQVIPSNINSSGTEERRSTMAMLGSLAHGAFNPGTGGIVGMAAIPLLYSKPGQALLRRYMMSVPPEASQLVGRYAPTTVGLGVAANQAQVGQNFADKALRRP